MSTDEQARAYLAEAELTLQAAKAIFASADGQELWAQVVKNAYDAIEQAVSAAIAARDQAIPRRHPAKINTFLDQYDLEEELEDRLLYWLRRRSESQYVDIRGDEINVPHEQFDQADAEAILDDAVNLIDIIRVAISGRGD